MRAFPNVRFILSQILGIDVWEDTTSVKIDDMSEEVLNKIPVGTEYDSEDHPGYDGESITLLYPDGQTAAVKWEGDVNSRNSHHKTGERVIDAVIRHSHKLGLPSAILLYTGHDAGSQPNEWKLTVYLWGTIGEGLLREIAGQDEARVLKALNYPFRKKGN